MERWKLWLGQTTFALTVGACLMAQNIAAKTPEPHSKRSSETTEALPVREADAVCGKCHEKILANYLKTPMANASGLAEERLLPGSYRDPSSGARYTIEKQDDMAWLRFVAGGAAQAESSLKAPADSTSGGGAPPLQGAERLHYFLGSGHIGLTYLYERNGYWLESPVAYYPQLQGYTMAPGAEGLHEMPPALKLNPSCLRCHMSGVAKQVEGTDNLYRGLPFGQTGITCESCHGDTREHVAAGGKAKLPDLMTLAPERRDSVCIVCHLEGKTRVERQGRSVLDYKPGDDIRESVTYFVAASADPSKRAVSEIEQFNTSRCKRTTGAAMSCMNCHDPHGSPAAAERVEYYRAKCLACHNAAPQFAVQHFPVNRDCTSCHMPKTGSENIAHVAWTDHRIRRSPETPALPASTVAQKSEAPELISVLPGEVSGRDLGLAYYSLAVGGVPAARRKAYALLDAAAKTSPADVAVLQSLGILAEQDGDRSHAASYYRRTLQVEPNNFIAQTNLGTILAASGDLEAAAALWQEAFVNNRDVPELGQNLALAECRLGDKERAQAVLTDVLTYSPGLLRPRRMLAGLQSEAMTCPAKSQPPLTLKPLP